MKELTIEEKAKRYDEALEYAKSALDWLGEDYICNHLTKDDIRGIYARLFPEELRESEVEPKFHKGDWIITNKNHIWYVDETPETTSYLYRLINQYGKIEVAEFEVVDEKARLWVIQDAKDGDVLATSNHILIFEKLLPKNGGVSYCHYDFGCSRPQFVFNKDNNWYFGKEAKVHPASKEQHDALMKAMADAGYTFDFDKKELKNVEQKPADKVEPKFKVGYWCIDNEDGTIFQIVKVLDNTYTYKTNEGKEYSCSHYSLENDARLWTIQDAKDGDVLFMDNGSANCIFIYKSSNNGIINKYASYNKFGFEGEHYIVLNDGYVIPATKEQRDFLFQKMKEAGYDWDSKKKELQMIERQPAWSEEDERLFQIVIDILDMQNHLGNISRTDLIACVRKLKSLRP